VAEKPLPRIIGMNHTLENLDAAKEEIDKLPSNSKIGLEMDVEHSRYSAAIKRVLPDEFKDNTFFSELAQYAISKGHTIRWLETVGSLNADSKYLLEVARLKSKMNKSNKLVMALLLPKLAYVLGKDKQQRIIYSKWRSGVMKNRTLGEVWKPTDLAFVGAVHARHLEKMLQTPVYKYIPARGNRQAQESYGLSEAGDWALRAARTIKKLGRRIKHGK